MRLAINLAKRIFEISLLIITSPFNQLIKKKYYIFYSAIGTTGNVKYVHDYFLSRGENVIFISGSSFSYWSVLQLLIKARYIFLSHGLGSLPLTVFLSKRIQLWHGLPIKKILLDYNRDTNKTKINVLNKLYKFLYFLRIRYSYNELVTSDCPLGIHLMNSMGFEASKVRFLGTASISQAKIISDKKSSSEKISNEFNVLYIPTWRDGGREVQDVIEELVKCNDFFNVHNIIINCKLHPMDLKVVELNLSYSNVKIIDKADDIIGLLSEHDCLITDYSSVCFEYYPFERPIIFYVPDIDKYFQNRESYIDIEDFYRGQPQSMSELLDTLMKIKNGTCSKIDLSHYIGDNQYALRKIYENYKQC